MWDIAKIQKTTEKNRAQEEKRVYYHFQSDR